MTVEIMSGEPKAQIVRGMEQWNGSHKHTCTNPINQI